MSKTSENRRLTFYRHLTSYVLANEVDKFVSTRLGKADQADVQLLIANGEAFNQFDCDVSQIEREKLYLALILSHISRFFHSHDPNHFSTFVRALYSQNSSRIVEKQLLDRFRTICLKKIAWLSDTSFFQDDDRRQRIIELIGDDLEEMDAFRNEEEEYTNDVMYDEICELIKSEERFKEQSLFFEISESLYEPYESLKQQTLLINHMNSIRNKRKLLESPPKVAENNMVAKTGDEKITTETTSTDNKKPRLSVHKENIESSEKMSVGGDSDKENNSSVQPEKTAIAKVGTKPRLSENRPIQNINNTNESEEFVDLDIAPSQHDAQAAVESTTTAATATEEAPSNEEKKEKEKNLDKSKMVRLRKNLDLDQLANSNGESSDDNNDDLDFGETDSDKERQKRVNALKSKKVDNEKTDMNKSSTEDDVEKKPRSPKETRETRKKKGLYTLVSDSDSESDDDKMELSHLRKVNLKNKSNVAKGNKKPSTSPKEEAKTIRNTPTRKSATRRATPKKEKTSGSDFDSCSESESSTSYRKASNTSLKKNESYKHRKTVKQRRAWSDEETIYLFVGIQICGMGHWSDILKKFSDKFNNRIGPDLKDRYRNVTKDARALERFEGEASRMIKTRSLAK